MKPRHLSLCSGYDGLGTALEWAFDAHTVAVSDIEPGACKILAHRRLSVPNLGDITSIDWSGWAGEADIISGGTPCQDLSHAGARAGMREGTRSNLWVAMREAIVTIRPQLVVWENVRGAFSAAADSALENCPCCIGSSSQSVALRALGRVLGDLSDLGYDANWYGLRASDVGAAHARFRVFVFATPAGAPPQPWMLQRPVQPHIFASRPLQPGDATFPTPTVSARNNRSASPGAAYRPSLRDLVPAVFPLLPTPVANDGNGRGIAPSEMRRKSPSLSAVARFHRDWSDYQPAIARQEAAFGYPAPWPSEPNRDGNPRLNARFSEWLMGLEPGWVTDTPGITRSEALKAIGNGVVPQQAYTAAMAFTNDQHRRQEAAA